MSRIKRSFAILVSLLVLMTSALAFPVSGVAAAEADVQTEQPVSAMVRIIEEEAVEKREEGVKYFRNNDNSFTAVVYDAPVHYEVGGKLEEIDNTLVLKKDADGQNVWQNRANDFSVSFPSSHNTGKVSVEYQGNALNFRLLPESNNATMVTLSAAASVVQPTSETALKEKLDSDLLAAQTDEEIAEILNADRSAVRNQSSEISYTNVLPNTTLQYQLSGKSLKENLIFETVPQATSFTYAFEYTGLVGVLQENGAVLFYEKEDTVRENYVFMIAPPYMFDSGDSLTMDVAVSFTETKTGALYTLTPSASWLNSPDRVYPVVLDPTVSTQQNSTMIEDVHVNEDSPTQNYYKVDRMYAGSWKSGSTIYENRIFMRFQLPTQITNPAWIINAKLTMSYYPTYSYQSASELELEIYPVTASWTSSNVKWSNQPAFASGTPVSYTKSNKGTSASLDTHKDTWYDLTSMVAGWYNGTNNGFVIKPKTKDTAKTNRACYVSSDSGVQAKRPVLSIAYKGQYVLTLRNYYDQAFAAQHGSEAANKIQQYIEPIQDYFDAVYGITINCTIQPYTSYADSCTHGKTSEGYCANNLAGICGEDEHHCTHAGQMLNQVPIGATAATHNSLIVRWTGNELCEGCSPNTNRKNCGYYSVSGGLNLMLLSKSEGVIRTTNEMIASLAHELGHSLGCPGHDLAPGELPCIEDPSGDWECVMPYKGIEDDIKVAELRSLDAGAYCGVCDYNIMTYAEDYLIPPT